MATKSVTRFLHCLCHETHEMSDDWRRGPLAKRAVDEKLINAAATTMIEAFNRTLAGVEGYYFPCHRVVLDVGTADDESGIPMDGRIVESDAGTSAYTLSLFGFGWEFDPTRTVHGQGKDENGCYEKT